MLLGDAQRGGLLSSVLGDSLEGQSLGAEPYEYTVPYEPDLQSALEKLRRRVFESKEFNGAEFDPPTPEAAFELTEADGTRSILDISHISERPEFCAAAPFSPQELERYFGTQKPTEAMVRESNDFWEDLERGMARYVILYDGDEPKGIYFAGYSFD
jgi:hypothetical protein